MKKAIICISLIIFTCFNFTACNNKNESDLWQDAAYTKDTEFGGGSKAVYVEVIAQDKSITFTINTDKETLGDALMEHNLISGEKGSYGLYVKFVNGIEADYDKTSSFWALTKKGESLVTGVDGEKIKNNDHYELTYTKQ